MLKWRNVAITILVSFVCILLVFMVCEGLFIRPKAQSANTDIQLAADVTLQQCQAIDDQFNSNDKMKLLTAQSNNAVKFTQVDLFPYYFSGSSDKETIYQKLFMQGSNAKAFNDWAKGYGYYPTQELFDTDTFSDVKTSKIARLGLDLYDATTQGKLSGTRNIYKNYGMLSHYNVSELYGGTSYYLFPQSVGCTYINKDLCSFLFLNNLDILMRAKYNDSGVLNLPWQNRSVAGLQWGAGMPTSQFRNKHEADNQDEAIQNGYINNGSFMVQRGALQSVKGKLMYRNRISERDGSNVDIKYKVIDMFDSKNDAILMNVFGSTAKQLKASDTSGISTKPIIVAYVTFKVDVFSPYTNICLRGWADQFGYADIPDKYNFVDMKRRNSFKGDASGRVTGINDTNGSEYRYTRAYAIFS